MWESAAQGDDRWESFSSDLNMTLERACFDVKNDISETVTIKGSLCHVRFQDMTAVPLGSGALVGMYLLRGKFDSKEGTQGG